MKKLEIRENIQTLLTNREISLIKLEFINRNEIKLNLMNGRLVIDTYGSRLKAHTADILADPSILPIKITIDLYSIGNGTELNVYMKEGYIGIPLFGLYKKYPKIFLKLIDDLEIRFYEKETQKDEKKLMQ